MSLREDIQNGLTAGRKKRATNEIMAFSSVLSAIQERESRENKTLDDDDILKVIEKEVKAQDEIKELYREKDRCRSLDAEVQGDILRAFLPKKVDQSQYGYIVNEAIQKTSANSIRDMGKVMSSLKDEYGQTLDYKLISPLVKAVLTSFN